MVSFYPGPSRVYDGVPRWTAEAARKGILSMNHRSPAFMNMVKETCALLQTKLNVPKSYSIFFVSSATECWEILAQSLIDKDSLHIHNGAFGEKWYQYTKRLKPGATEFHFDRETLPDLSPVTAGAGTLLCLTHNETSNGTALPVTFMRETRKKFPSNLIAVDATSSMAGVALDFKLADAWFASVQKCFGLPAGLALLICSPAAMARAGQLNEALHYNSLVYMQAMMDKFQTTHTPNVLGIYLLNRSLRSRNRISVIDRAIRNRAKAWYSLFETHASLRPLIREPKVRSHTVVTVTAQPVYLEEIKKKTSKKGILLGEGYGNLKATTARVANFPAIKTLEIRRLMQIFHRL